MDKRPLGNTGMEVSEVAFGGVEIGMPYGIGVRSAKDMLEESEAIRLLHQANSRGINFFDTARMYGNSEALMGKAFRDRRKEVILCTKCRHFPDQDGNIPSGKVLAGIIHNSLDESLKALQTDYIDVFMLHQGNMGVLKNGEIASILTHLKQEGKVRSIGISTYTVEETDFAIDSDTWEVVQLPFNLLDQRQVGLFDKASHKGVGLVVRSVLLKGLLSDRGKNLPKPLKNVERHIDKYRDLTDEFQVDLPALAVKFTLSFEQVASVLVGIDKLSYLEHAIDAGDGNYLDGEWLDKARALAYPDPEFIDLPYWDRMGWLT